MVKATGLTFSLFEAREVPLAILLYIECILHGPSSLLTMKGVDFVVGTYVMASIPRP